MPWKFFTKYGTPDLSSSAITLVEVGQIFMYCGTSAPAGFLLCDGSEKLISNYQRLYDFFTANSLSFGTPSNPSNFVLPNFIDSIPVGYDTTDVDFSTVGQTGGSKTHTHTVPSHTHTTPAHKHAASNHQHSYPDHTHSIPAHLHSHGSLRHDTPVGGFVWVYNQASDPLVEVEYAAHVHDVIFSTANNGAASSTTPKKSDGTDKNTTDNQTTVNSSNPTDTSLGTDSPATQLLGTGSAANASVPPYYTLNFLIKA